MLHLPNDNMEETRQFLQYVETEWKKEKPSFFEFTILLNGLHIEAISIHLVEHTTEAELGWIIHMDHWGNGYASEAALAIKTLPFIP